MTGRVVIWGIGQIYNQYVNAFRYLEAVHKIKIVGLTDKRLPNYSSLDGWRFIRKNELQCTDFDWIIVMSKEYFTEIANDAKEIGVDESKIFSYKIMNIPNLDFEQYYLLKKSKVSIISNNCWGGLFYSTLGMECCSPFKNLFVEDEDYIRLLSDFKNYMSKELLFSCFGIDSHSHQKYPIMLLGDIKVHCNHDSDPKEAKMKWNRRIQKLNWDNIFVEMYTENVNIAERFARLDEFSNKIAFVPFKSDCGCVKQIEWYPGHIEFYETVNRNASDTGYMFDILDVLSAKISSRVE